MGRAGPGGYAGRPTGGPGPVTVDQSPPVRKDAATILVVDDDVSLRSSMARALERDGYRVLQAGSAFEARKAMKGSDRIDLIVMDLVLPGMEGREAANLLKADRPGVTVLYVSGYTSQESLRSGLVEENELFMRKPFEVEELLETVREALASG